MGKAISPKGFGAPLGMYSHGMVVPAGEQVIVAGQVGMAPGGGLAVGDVVAQTKQALENVRAVVEAAGSTMRDIVRFQTFLTRSDDLAGFMKARQEVFPGYFPDGVYPPNTLLVVSRLVRPELLVEIEATAVRAMKLETAPSKPPLSRGVPQGAPSKPPRVRQPSPSSPSGLRGGRQPLRGRSRRSNRRP